MKQWIGVGGTMTSIASMLQGLETYDPAKIQGYVIHAEDVSALLRKLYQMSYEDRCQFRGSARTERISSWPAWPS